MFKHNRKTIVASVAMLLCSGAAQAVIVDIAENGGFEAAGGSFDGWTQFPNGGTQTIITPGSASNNAANLFVPVRTQTDPAVDNLIKNANKTGGGTVTPGASITVTWDMRGQLTGAGGVVFVELFSELSGGGTSKAEIYTGGPLFPTNAVNWTPYSWTTTLGPDVSGGVTLQLKASCGPVLGCGVSADFDNITMTTDVTPVPVPAAVWLFGSGLMGLVGFARRKKVA